MRTCAAIWNFEGGCQYRYERLGSAKRARLHARKAALVSPVAGERYLLLVCAVFVFGFPADGVQVEVFRICAMLWYDGVHLWSSLVFSRECNEFNAGSLEAVSSKSLLKAFTCMFLETCFY